MKASFVIVNYNRRDEVLLTLSKTKEITKANASNFEIIVVDNASTDGSAETIAANFPEVILIKNPVNTGAPAWNLAFEEACSEYMIILDDDSHIESGLEEALDYLDKNLKVGILALNISGGLHQTYDWKNLSERAGFIGCGAIFRKSLYKKIGGYPDWMFLYSNELDLAMRTLLAGFKIIYFEKCHVFHRVSSLHRTSKRLVEFSVAHEMSIIYKYFPKNKQKLYLVRTFLNNLKLSFKYGLHSFPWYFAALKKYNHLKRNLMHTPVTPDILKLYTQQVWKTKPFLRIF